MRIALRLDPKINLLPCVSVSRDSVKEVLLQLLTNILMEIEGN
jgi:hypothetical protein